MLRRFILDTRKYFKYAVYSGRAELKSEIANSYLSWLWWILDPVFYMLIFILVKVIIFKNDSIEYYPIFVYIGLTCWGFFNRTVTQSVKIVNGNKKIVSRVYLPKFVLIYTKMYVNGFKMLISFGIIAVMMLYSKVPLSVHCIEVVPLLLLLFLMVFSCGTCLLHFGVYVEDLQNALSLVLRFFFYLSGVFFNISGRLDNERLTHIVLWGNPVAFLLHNVRNVLLYHTMCEWPVFCLWFLFFLVLAVIGVRLIYKNENSYIKTI